MCYSVYSTDAISLHKLISANPGQVGPIMAAMNNTTVYIVNAALNAFMTYQAGNSAPVLSLNQGPMQKWVVKFSTTPAIVAASQLSYTLQNGRARFYSAADQNAALIAQNDLWIRYGQSSPNNEDQWFIVNDGCGFTLRNVGYMSGTSIVWTRKKIKVGTTISDRLNIADEKWAGGSVTWDLLIVDPVEFCTKLPSNIAFAFKPCNGLSPGSLLNTLASAYCVGQTGTSSTLMVNKNCQNWCLANPTLCDPVMTSYCVAHPTDPACACIYATKQQDYKDFMAKNPGASGPAGCFTKACQGTNFVTTLIPSATQQALLGCPSITTQQTNQNVNVGTGAIVGSIDMTANQNAGTSGAPPTQTVTQAPITANVAVPSYFWLFVFIVFVALFFAWLLIGDEPEPMQKIDNNNLSF